MPHLEADDLHACQTHCAALQHRHAALAARVQRTALRIPAADLLGPADFVDVKRGDVRHGVRALHARQRDLLAALAKLPPRQHAPLLRAALADVRAQLADRERELVLLGRQRATLARDLADERRAAPAGVEDAYLRVLAPKLAPPPPAADAHRSATGAALKAKVLDFYGALRPDCAGAHCCLFGLSSFAAVRAACLVPHGFESPELAGLFGVRDVDLTDPRNHLPLARTAQRALDDGLIVFVPAAAAGGGNVQWQCKVVDAPRADELAVGGRRWKV